MQCKLIDFVQIMTDCCTRYGDVIPDGGVMLTLQSMPGKSSTGLDSLNSPKVDPCSTNPSPVNSKENTPKRNSVTINIPPASPPAVSPTAIDDSHSPMDISGGILLRTIQRGDETTGLSHKALTGFSSPVTTLNSYSSKSNGQFDSYAALVEKISKGCGSLNKHQLSGYHGTYHYDDADGDAKSDGMVIALRNVFLFTIIAGATKDTYAKGDIVSVCVVLKVNPHMGFIPDWMYVLFISCSFAYC